MATLEIIPVQPIPAQTFVVQLAGQRCRLTIYEKKLYNFGPTDVINIEEITTREPALFADVYKEDVLVVGGVLVRDSVGWVQNLYFGFIGELIMIDVQGNDDPQYAGLGSRWLLGYLNPTT